MSEMFKLVAKLTLDTSEFDRNTEESKEKASVFADVLKADLVGRGISAAWDGLKKLAGAVKDFTAEAVGGYAQYEQLSGGISKLFGTAGLSLEEYAKQQGESIDAVRDKYAQLLDAEAIIGENAAKAFETAGISANAYMEQVSSFSAALINSLGGDTVKAAERADTAMRAISDNVNTFGTDIGSVQTAFQGFAKQNYTMLDNLKLGYGGTKSEMERLIEDANEYGKTLGMAGDLSIDSFADIVTAIDLVQQKQGIAGTTAREASTTIEGSVNAAKAAWENFVAGIANPDANFGDLITNLVDTSTQAIDNIVPVVGRALSGMGVMIGRLAPIIMNKIPEIFKDLGPDLGEAALAMVEYIADAFTENVPKLLEAGASMIQSLGEGLTEGIPQFLEMALPLIEDFSESFKENVGHLVDLGIEFILNLVQGIMNSLPLLIEQAPQIIINFANAINENAPKLLMGGVQLLVMVGQGIINAIPTLIANIPKIFEAIIAVWQALNWINLGKNVIEFIKNGIDQLSTNLPQALKDIGNKAIEWFKGIDWAHAGTQAINFIKSAIIGVATLVPQEVLNIANKAWEWFNDVDWYSLGSNIIDGIIQGLKDGVRWIKDAAMDVAQKAKDAAEDLLGIASPSKVFRYEIGQMIPKGLALGIDDAAVDAIESAEKLSKSVFKPFEDLDAPVLSVATENSSEGAFSQDFGTIMTEYIRANNDALTEAVYTAFNMMMREGGFVINLDGRELGRVLRDKGVVMA